MHQRDSRDRQYQWRRFWYKIGELPDLSDDGYLRDPEASSSFLVPSNLIGQDSLLRLPCVVLLGEPGMGKSTVINDLVAETKTRVAGTDDVVLAVDLANCISENQLQRELFDDPAFQNWRLGSHRLHLFLDSLDEAIEYFPYVTRVLARELTRLPVAQLLLRIVCRSADWQDCELSKTLSDIWGDRTESVKKSPPNRRDAPTYELAPLRRADVALTVAANGLDPIKFLEAVARARATPFASRPITLHFLLASYQRDGQLSAVQPDLYETGLHELCLEPERSRRGNRPGHISPQQILAAAGHVAAVMLLAQRRTIWLGRAGEDDPSRDVTSRELAEPDPASPFSEQNIWEALGTAIFTWHSSERATWVHQTYAEYLAARHIVKQVPTTEQIFKLLAHPLDPANRVAPPLRNVAAWIASMNAEVLNELLRRDPEVLLRADLTNSTSQQRAALIDELLHLHELDKAHDEVRKRGVFQYLHHPGLSDQLRPYIRESHRPFMARIVAIRIAEDCLVRSLLDDLLIVALEAEEPGPLRVAASRAVSHYGDRDAIKSLWLLLDPAANDPDDELRGCAFRILWPGHVSTAALFDALTPPKRENFIGQYWMFLAHELVPSIQPDDLPLALAWVGRLPENRPRIIETLVSDIMLRGWEHIDHPGVIPAFTQAVFAQMQNHGNLFEYIQTGQDHRVENLLRNWVQLPQRRRVVEELLPLLSETSKRNKVIAIFMMQPRLVVDDDVDWLISRLAATTDQSMQHVLAVLIDFLFRQNTTSHIDSVYEAMQWSPVLVEQCGYFFEPIPLASPEAEQARTYYEWELQRQRRETDVQPEITPVPVLLEAGASGDPRIWFDVAYALHCDENGVAHRLLSTDITELSGWRRLENWQEQIVDLAEKYVRSQPIEARWATEPEKITFPELFSYQALRLILKAPAERLQALSGEVWQKWAPVIIAMPDRM